jgi:NDP-sugar pyrophosphorylase family protein
MADLPKVLVLAGGLGTRLRPLTETTPKVLVPALGRPFLEHVIEDLARQGLKRFVLSVGFLADQVEAWFGDGARLGCVVEYAREASPLGTGGAMRHALPLLGETFVVVNGDTLLELDVATLLAHHHAQCLPVTLAAAWVPDRGRYGALVVEDGRVARFEEKREDAGAGLINGGIYVVDAAVLHDERLPRGPFSFERELLPQLAGRIAAFETHGYFVDMGTHEALASLDASLAAYLAARRPTSG